MGGFLTRPQNLQSGGYETCSYTLQQMKYFLIAGEASGDLHASRLMLALKEQDPQAQFRFFGGDKMKAAGGLLLTHYRDIAYMGFIPVLLHARTILKAMRRCREAVLAWQPDVLILVDYPGFNLKIARYIKEHTTIPVYYYISPKIWAWKERRIRQIKAYVDEMFSILPFEVDFYEKKHSYPIHYVGNPSVDEITLWRSHYHASLSEFLARYSLPQKPVIALLPGSRTQEIKDNLLPMLKGVKPFLRKGYIAVIATAPNIPQEYYSSIINKALGEADGISLIKDATFALLSHSVAALVTSGTATLETALISTPQVVCYYTPLGAIVSWLRSRLLHVPYISLVNLIAGRGVVPELVADTMTSRNITAHLENILPGGNGRQAQLDGYALMTQRLGPAGAPLRAAKIMIGLLSSK